MKNFRFLCNIIPLKMAWKLFHYKIYFLSHLNHLVDFRNKFILLQQYGYEEEPLLNFKIANYTNVKIRKIRKQEKIIYFSNRSHRI